MRNSKTRQSGTMPLLRTDKKEHYRAGLRAGLPCILGFFPVGIAYAIMARQAGLSIFQTTLMSACVYAGASQMLAMGLYMQGAGLFAMILGTFVINLRHVIMSLCIFERMEPAGAPMKMLCGFGVTDEGFAIFTTGEKRLATAPFFLGLNTVTYASWVLGSFTGAVAMDFLPQIIMLSLGVALYGMFIGLLVPNLKGNARLAVLVGITALCSWGLSKVMASSWAMIVSTLVCALIGVFFADPEPETAAAEPGEEVRHD